MPEPIRVVVADDQLLVRTGFRVILDSEPDLSVVGEADTGGAALRLARELRPDVVLMDIRMPEMDGLTATERLSRLEGGPRVVVLTTFDQTDYLIRALRAGAYGFLLKDAPPARLLAAVRAAAAGDALIEPAMTRRLVESVVARNAPAQPTAEIQSLTDRERDILRLLARGLSNSEIAAERTISETTVKTHVARILTKLGVRDRVQAVVTAYESGFVTPGT